MVQADRLPPHDIQAEESVIGSLLIDGQAVTDVHGFLNPGDFYRQRNRICFEAVVDLFNRDEAINTVTVAHELESKGLLEEVGGTAYLAHLVATRPDFSPYRPFRTTGSADCDYAQANQRRFRYRRDWIRRPG